MTIATNLKRRLGSLGLGLLILGGALGYAFFVSNDMRVIYALGAIPLFFCAVWLGAKGKRDWLAFGLLCAPLLAVFGLLVLVQMPVLWPHLLLWFVATIIGFYLLDPARPSRLSSLGAAGLLVAVSFWYCMAYLPQEVARSLTHFRDLAGPKFALQPVSDGPVPTGPVAGKILVIDFFSTTCAPCIAELPELARARAELQGRNDIEFVVAASDFGGDTPERFKAFATRRHITLPLAFDPGGKAHAAFGFSGVPALVVLDRTNRVRFTHEGYNGSEINFRRDLVRFLESL